VERQQRLNGRVGGFQRQTVNAAGCALFVLLLNTNMMTAALPCFMGHDPGRK
jgi:hypothetical protein